MLHDRTGGSADNIDQVYTVEGFAGVLTPGTWQLKATDHLIGFAGTLTSWTLRATGSVGPQPPIASFTHTANRLAVQFTDTSTDVSCSGGSITSRAWNFGDGATSTAQNPSHTYAAAGTYTVSLTVTDSEGLSATVSHDVTVTRPTPVLAIERIQRNRLTFEFAVDLTWTAGLQGALVDMYRNNILVDIPNNDGVHRRLVPPLRDLLRVEALRAAEHVLHERGQRGLRYVRGQRDRGDQGSRRHVDLPCDPHRRRELGSGLERRRMRPVPGPALLVRAFGFFGGRGNVSCNAVAEPCDGPHDSSAIVPRLSHLLPETNASRTGYVVS